MVVAALSSCVCFLYDDTARVQSPPRSFQAGVTHPTHIYIYIYFLRNLRRLYDKRHLWASSQAVMKSLWSASVCFRFSSHTPVCFTRGVTGNLTEGREGYISLSIIPARSAVSGPAERAGGQGRSTLSPFIVSVSITEDHLFPPPLKRCLFSEVFPEKQDGQLRSAHTKITDVKYSADLFPMCINSTSSCVLLFKHEFACLQDDSVFFFFLTCRNRLYFTKMLPSQKKKKQSMVLSSPVQMALEDSGRTAF